MLKTNAGKLMVYASTGAPHKRRLQSVRTAAEETARRLNLDFEMVNFEKRASQIYVYYEDGGDEPVPLYCDEGKQLDLCEISAKLRKMMFVLSFHPKHSVLRQMRTELMAVS
jgi:hypothetical protein